MTAAGESEELDLTLRDGSRMDMYDTGQVLSLGKFL